mgnify:CR=1 FL=1
MTFELGEFVEIIPAQQRLGPEWYQGTADALWQNMEIIRAHRPLHVLVLAGDHIYKMDYGPMIGFHVEKEADITVGVVEVPLARAREFGVRVALGAEPLAIGNAHVSKKYLVEF